MMSNFLPKNGNTEAIIETRHERCQASESTRLARADGLLVDKARGAQLTSKTAIFDSL
jgi:hypothetical protein